MRREIIMEKYKDDGFANPTDEEQLFKTKLAMKIISVCFFLGYNRVARYEVFL